MKIEVIEIIRKFYEYMRLEEKPFNEKDRMVLYNLIVEEVKKQGGSIK